MNSRDSFMCVHNIPFTIYDDDPWSCRSSIAIQIGRRNCVSCRENRIRICKEQEKCGSFAQTTNVLCIWVDQVRRDTNRRIRCNYYEIAARVCIEAADRVEQSRFRNRAFIFQMIRNRPRSMVARPFAHGFLGEAEIGQLEALLFSLSSARVLI